MIRGRPQLLGLASSFLLTCLAAGVIGAGHDDDDVC